VGWKIVGLWLGILLGTVFAFSAYTYERRRGRPGMIARFVLAFVVLQAVIGLATGSAKAYLVQPTILGAVNGLVWLGSVAIGRPLAAVFAREVFPVSDDQHKSDVFRSTFRLVTLVWGSYFVAFGCVQLAVLLIVGVDAYVELRVADTLIIIALILGSIRLITGRLGPPTLPAPEPA
jgi:intracellular septation protein A